MAKEGNVLFRSFKSDKERKDFGCTAFIELQFCKLPAETSVADIVKVWSISHWKNDSLYIFIKENNLFWKEYSNIITGGTYNNLKSGAMDLCGINYYNSELVQKIIDTIKIKQPLEYETILDWLEKSKEYNGFYILGL